MPPNAVFLASLPFSLEKKLKVLENVFLLKRKVHLYGQGMMLNESMRVILSLIEKGKTLVQTMLPILGRKELITNDSGYLWSVPEIRC